MAAFIQLGQPLKVILPILASLDLGQLHHLSIQFVQTLLENVISISRAVRRHPLFYTHSQIPSWTRERKP